MDILSFGEILFDVIEDKAYLGGAPLNFAAHMSKLGHNSYILSRIGADELGKRALKEIREIGVDDKFIQSDRDHATGRVTVELENGQPHYTFSTDSAYDHIDLEAFILDYTVEQFGLLYYGTLAQRGETSRSTLLHVLKQIPFDHILFDVNLRQEYYTAEIIHTGLHHCTILKVNDEETTVLAKLLFDMELDQESLARKIVNEFQLDLMIITAGEKGCYICHGEKYKHISSSPVTVRDSIGAGDAFSAAFIHSFLKDGDPEQAAARANLLGGFVASQRGAIPVYSDEIRNQLELTD